MGSCVSKGSSNDSNEDYNSLYHECRLLGKGEFGTVKLVREISTGKERAVKIINKGVTFKDKTIYLPPSTKAIWRECDILRKLQGKEYNLKIFTIFESFRKIRIVTECCVGGDMNEWVSHNVSKLCTNIVSRIAYQLLHAVAFCHRNGIIHRDIKPENIMFSRASETSDLRLIDFGSSSIDYQCPAMNCIRHTTYTGTAFYNSPELFMKSYTEKTDIWSIGVSLYVLLAGYPSENVYDVFYALHEPSRRKIRHLPNMPQDLPEACYILLDELLVHDFTCRKTAENMCKSKFLQFHKNNEDNDYSEASSVKVLEGGVDRHKLSLGFRKFQMCVATICAAMLTDEIYSKFIKLLDKGMNANSEGLELINVRKKLGMVAVVTLVKQLELLKQFEVARTIRKLGEYKQYEKHSFNIQLLRLLTIDNEDCNEKSFQVCHSNDENNSVHGTDVWEKYHMKRPSVADMCKTR